MPDLRFERRQLRDAHNVQIEGRRRQLVRIEGRRRQRMNQSEVSNKHKYQTLHGLTRYRMTLVVEYLG